jgi:LysM repeat protein
VARFIYGRKMISWRKWFFPVIIVIVFGVFVAILFSYNPFKKDRKKAPRLSVTGNAKLTPIEQQSEAAKNALKSTPEEKIVSEPSVSSTASETVLEPDAPPNPKTDDLIREATKILEENPNRIIEARQLLNDALMMATNPQQQGILKRKLSELSDQWLFSKTIYPQDKLCGTYQVEPGEQLRYIGRTFNVPYEALMEINKISDATKLQADQVIKIVHGPFHAIIDRSEFAMDLYLQDTFVKSFQVGLGMEDMETPTGLWVIQQGGKLIKPRWTDPLTQRTYEPDDPDYPLGSRWIGLEGIEGDALGRQGFAIHGTKDPETIGTRSSQGCIRLHNGNAILIYKLLEEGISKVRVID